MIYSFQEARTIFTKLCSSIPVSTSLIFENSIIIFFFINETGCMDLN